MRRLAAVIVLATSLAATLSCAAPAQAASSLRDVLVYDLISANVTPEKVEHVVYDSSAGTAPVTAPSPVQGGVRATRAPSDVSGPGLEVLPADGTQLTVGHYAHVLGSWTSGSRPLPVVQLVDPRGDCRDFVHDDDGVANALDVQEAVYDGTGTLTRFAATFTMTCVSYGQVVAGTLLYQSDLPYASAGSPVTSLGQVVTGSRTPVTVTVHNDGTRPLSLGAPEPVPSARYGTPDTSTLEVTAAGETCSSGPVPAGSSCVLHLDYVDDGVRNGDLGAQVRLRAPDLPRGYVLVIVSAEPLYPPTPPTQVTGDVAFDGIHLHWLPSGPEGIRVRRLDGPSPTLLATLPGYVTSFDDTNLAKGESATYQVSSYNAAGDGATAPITLTRPDLPDPPPAGSRNVVVVEEQGSVGISDSATGGSVTVTPSSYNGVHISTGHMMLDLPRVPGPGTYPVGGPSGLRVDVFGPEITCDHLTGSLDVREAWIRADLSVHRLDLDAHLRCVGTLPVEVQLRLGTPTPVQAVTSSAPDGDLTAFSGTVGQPATHRRVELHNTGDVDVALGAATVSGADAGAFRATSACPTTLAAGATCDIDVAFTPVRAYASSAQLSVGLGTPIGTRLLALGGDAIGPPPARLPNPTAVLGRVLVPLGPFPDGGAPITAFHVQRADATGDFATVQDLPGSASSWTDGPLTPGATYRYRVVVDNQYGSVAPGDAQTATVTIPREEILAAIGQHPTDPYDLASVPVGNGTPVPLGTGQDTDYPAASPDGRWLAYTAYDAQGNADLWLRSTDGSSPPRALVATPDVDETEPAWSPDSRALVFTADGPTSTLLEALDPSSGQGPHPLPGGASAAEASWLADGSGVVATDLTASRTRLVTIAADGTRTVLAGTDEGSGPAVSPRGDRIAYVSTDGQGVDHLWLVPTTGGASTSVATEAVNVLDRPVWSPDGSAVVVNELGLNGEASVLLWRDGAAGTAPTWSTERLAVGYDVFGLSWRRQDREAPAITFASAAAVTGARFTVPVQVVDDTVPVGGLDVTCSVDGTSVGRCTHGYRGALADGPHTLTVSATDPFGHTGRSSFTWTVRQPPPVITFPGAATRSTGTVHVPVQVTADVPGVTVSCLLDGAPAGDCRAGLDASEADGSHTLTVTATDPQGAAASADLTWVVDTQAPQVSVVPLPAVATAGSLVVRWAATDPSGIGSYDLRYRSALRGGPFSAYVVPADAAGTSSTSRTLGLSPGYEYCVSVRARDGLGTVSDWTRDTCAAAPVDDRALHRASTGWTSLTSPTAYHRTLTRAVRPGALLTVATGSGITRRVVLVATTCPTCGSVDVLVGGVRVRTVSLRTTAARPGSLLGVALPHPVRSTTLGVRSTGTAQVLVDGLALRDS